MIEHPISQAKAQDSKFFSAHFFGEPSSVLGGGAGASPSRVGSRDTAYYSSRLLESA